MQYLTFELSEGHDGEATWEAQAGTRPGDTEAHAAVMAEVQHVLAWAQAQFPGQHGPLEDGMAWDHALSVQVEAGGWHTVSLTLAGGAAFIEAFRGAFDNGDAAASA